MKKLNNENINNYMCISIAQSTYNYELTITNYYVMGESVSLYEFFHCISYGLHMAHNTMDDT